IALAQYSTADGPATLMIMSYPTPQIAAERLRAIEAAVRASTGEANVADRAKRTGPMVVLASGNISNSDAQSLLASVNYDADVTWNQNTFFTKRDNLANLLVGVILLVAILIGFALVAGLLFGGFRVLMSRLFPNRIFDPAK